MYIGMTVSICSLIYACLVLIVYLNKIKVKNDENIIYSFMISSNIIGLILEFLLYLYAIFPNSKYLIIPAIMERLYFTYLLTWVYLFAIYIYITSHESENNYKIVSNKSVIIFLVMIYLLLIGLVSTLPINHIVNDIGTYSTGPACYVLYIVASFSIVVSIMLVWKKKKIMKAKKKLPIISLISCLIMMLIIRKIIPEALFASSMLSFVTVLTYFTIENPDIKMTKDLEYSRKIVEDSRNKTMEMFDFMSMRLKKLEDNINSMDGSKDIKTIQKHYLELTNDISGLIDLGKIESGYLELNKNEYLTQDLFDYIKKILSYSYKKKKVKTSIEYDTDIPPVLYGDYKKVEQMFLYTYEYLIEIIKSGKLEIKVDIIKVNNLCKLKFIFNSIDKVISSDELVDNIAYTKVRRLSELINAKIIYKGNNVLELSIIQKIKSPYKLLTKEMDNTKIKYFNACDKRVLIITNKVMDMKNLKLLLEPYHIEIDLSRTFADAKEKMLGNTTYDLIFIDDIIENKYILRKNPYEIKFLKKFAGYDFKCIIMLRKRFADEYEYYFEKGYNDYIVKPIDKKSLDNILIKYLKNK